MTSLLFLLTGMLSANAGNITDSTGTKITIDNPKRIVTLSANVTETVFAIGLGDSIVGVDSSSLYPQMATNKSQVGYYRRINAEGLLGLAPDLIIATDAAGPPEVIEKIRKSGIPMAILSSEASLKGAQNRIEQISTLLDKKKEGHTLVWEMQDQLAAMRKPKEQPKVLFIYARSGGTQNVAGLDTSANAMIELAGGINAVQGYTGYKPMNAEAILAAQPDYVLFTSRGLESIGGVETAKKLPGISETPAAANDKIISIDDLLLLGFGPRTAEGVMQLSELLQD
ncbi:MAG: heme/hemin ABC transporter substrate-binding protein [Myxococcota bacterium]